MFIIPTSKRQLLLLSLWICSYTCGVDIISEFKLFDIISVIGFIAFREHLSLKNIYKDRLLLILFIFINWAIFGTIVTYVRTLDYVWIVTVCLRLFRLFCYAIIFFIIRQIDLSKQQLNRLLNVILYVIGFQGILVFLQYQGMMPILWAENEQYYGTVYTGTMGINHLNSVLFMSLGLCLVIGKAGDGWQNDLKKIIIPSVFSVIMVGSMLIAEARSSFIAIAIIFVTISRKIKLFLHAVFLFLLGFFVVSNITSINIYDIFHKTYEHRIESKIEKSQNIQESAETMGGYRYKTWVNVIDEMLESPSYLIIGTGFQNFKDFRVSSIAAHNQYLHVLGELGIGGFMVYIYFLGCLGKNLLMLCKYKNANYSRIIYPAFSFYMMLLSVGIFNETFYPSRAVPGFMGMAFAYFAIVTHRGWFGFHRPFKNPNQSKNILYGENDK